MNEIDTAVSERRKDPIGSSVVTHAPKTSAAAGILATRDWLIADGRRLSDAADVIRETAHHIAAAGCLLSRLMVSIRTLHPQVAAISYAWNASSDEVEIVPRGYSVLEADTYLASPIRLIHAGEPMIRRRLVEQRNSDDFPILAELRAAGATDYVVLPLRFSGNRTNAVSFTTKRPDGFADDVVEALRSLSEVLALVLDPLETRRIARALLGTYLGADAGRRVLEGLVRRGDGVTIAAALMFTDMRGFTQLSENSSREQILDTLNQYFDALTPAVRDEGGEILKFVGDGMLAIFPMHDDLDRDRACHSALRAAKAGSAAIDALNETRRADGLPPLDVGITLHSGSVSYGNIGAADRLDFTVIGPAVNLVSRMQGLCEPLGRRILTSKRFASSCHSELVPVGAHRFKGIAQEQEIYGLPG